jgi:hypothetical protein
MPIGKEYTNMTNVQNKLLKIVREITEQPVNHNFFFCHDVLFEIIL